MTPETTPTVPCPHCKGSGTMPSPGSVGGYLVVLRKAMGYRSCAAAADAMRIKRTTLWRLETGRTTRAKSDLLATIATHYGVSVAAILGSKGGSACAENSPS